MARQNNKGKVLTMEEKKIALTALLTKDQTDMPYVSGAIVNGNEQPIIVSSSEDLKTHIINLGRESFTVPEHALPYLIDALQNLQTKNLMNHFKNDAKKVTDHIDNLRAKNPVEYFDLSDEEFTGGCGDPSCTNCGGSDGDMTEYEKKLLEMHEPMSEKLNGDEFKQLDPEEKDEVVEKMTEVRDLLKQTSKELDEGKLSPEDQRKLREENSKMIYEKMKETEAILKGKKAQYDEDIDLEHIKRIMTKHGQEAAHEELMRLPEEKRDEILAKLIDSFKQ